MIAPPWIEALFDDAEVAGLWGAKAQLAHYRRFEQALALALEATGQVAAGQGAQAAQAIGAAPIDIAALAQASGCDGLPIPEFVRQLRAHAPTLARAIHTGATSQDVLDTALSLSLQQVTGVLRQRLGALNAQLAGLIDSFGQAPMMGRTRMQAALPITVADRVDNWRRPLADHIAALDAHTPALQLGGAVGTRHAFGEAADAVAAHMAQALGLANIPCWHSDRTRVVDYANRLSLITGTLGKMGQDVALMAQQGVDDIALEGGGGSSAMPHKSNPILAELLVTLARHNATQVAGLHQALIHEQERSGAAWMLEWMILPQISITTARALSAAQTLCASVRRVGPEAKGGLA